MSKEKKKRNITKRKRKETFQQCRTLRMKACSVQLTSVTKKEKKTGKSTAEKKCERVTAKEKRKFLYLEKERKERYQSVHRVLKSLAIVIINN